MADLDYVRVVGRFGIVVRDNPLELGLEPETIWCDAGEIRFTPLISSVKVTDATPVPVTLGQAVISATVDSSGYLSFNGTQEIQLVDLSSTKVNPYMSSGKATHKVEFLGMKAGVLDVKLPTPVNVRLAADMADENGVVDLTRVMPVPVSGGTAQIIGPRGYQGVQGPEGPEGPTNFLVYESGAYPTRASSEPQVFVGPVNPDSLGLMTTGDVWINPDDTSNPEGVSYIRPDEAFLSYVLGESYYISGAPTYSGDDLVSAPVTWPDLSTGVLTIVSRHSSGVVTQYTATTSGGPVGNRIYTVTIPRDSAGKISGAMTVSVS